jgi:hypothetical protein
LPDDRMVHWLGTGLSTGPGIRALDGRLTLWGRTQAKAEACARRLGLTDTIPAAFTSDELARRLTPGDVVVSMLPATEHAALVALCLRHGAHFACSSYTSPELAALARRAGQAGLVVLTEAGLDPGLDHLIAHVAIGRALAAIGDEPATVSLTSYCGGLPAVANEFRYRFSWAPRGVLTALLQPARYLEDGTVHEAVRPWEATRPHLVGGESFEAYPNRDSIPFLTQYRLPPTWEVSTFVRGTLRLDGWRTAWSDVFATLQGDGGTGVDELAADLARRYPCTEDDRDRVVLAVDLDVETRAGHWSARCVLDLQGDETASAMARCVTTPLVVGVERILDGRLAPGLSRAAEGPGEAELWIEELSRRGLPVTLTQTGRVPQP